MSSDAAAASVGRSGSPGWAVVAAQELRDLWLGGRGLVMGFAFAILLSVVSYLVATNEALNYLEQRESVNLTLQVAIAVGSLLALLVAADSVSGERERSTLESLLLTPVSRLSIAAGKLVAALSTWFVAFVLTIPYVWFLGRGIGVAGEAIAAGFVVGTLLAVFLVGLGFVLSVVADSNRVSLSLGLFLLLVLFVPTQFPLSAKKGWLAEALLRVNPVTAGEHSVGQMLVHERAWTEDASWLVSPVVAALLFTVLAALVGKRYLGLGRAGSR